MWEWSVAHPHAVEETGVDFQIVEGSEGARGGEISAQGEESGVAGFFVWGVLGWYWNWNWREGERCNIPFAANSLINFVSLISVDILALELKLELWEWEWEWKK